jgi:hypothetical protein
VRGYLAHLDSGMIERMKGQFDPEPWAPNRESWLALTATTITGRRLRTAEIEWAFHVRGYL